MVAAVARRLAFAKTLEGGLHTYRYQSDTGPFERSWPGLYGEWPSVGPTPWTEWAVNNNNGEEVALYLGLIWRLTDGLRRYGVPRYDREARMYAAGEPYALVDWEHQVEDIDTGKPGRVAGFVPARSSVRVLPVAGPWQREHAGRAGLFEIATFRVLREVIRGLLGDTTGKLNLYALNEPVSTMDTFKLLKAATPMPTPRGTELASALRGPEAPHMSALLSPGELYVDLTIGVDLGYDDVIVVQSVDEIEDRLGPLLDEYAKAVEDYEAEIDGLVTVEQVLVSLARLVGVPESGRL